MKANMAHLEGELFHSSKLSMVTVSCPLCESNDHRTYEKFGETYQYQNVRCIQCGFIFQNPRFFYDDNFLKWAYSWYGDGFITSAGDGEYPTQEGNGYFKFKKNLIDCAVAKRPYTLLDVGCACGEFLSFCKGKFCTVAGIETSKAQAAFVQQKLGITVHCGTPSDFIQNGERYDVVHMAHTLEHTPDPKASLRDLMKLTNPDGIIFIEVPNVRSAKNTADHYSAALRLRKNTWKPGDFPEHLVEFTPTTLRKLLDGVGLELLDFRCHSRSAVKRGGLKQSIDHWANRIFPMGNNLIAIARMPSKTTQKSGQG